jgi:hypothetical protein
MANRTEKETILKITVTEDHIKRGRPCRAESCPAALAVKEKINQICVVSSGMVRYYVPNHDQDFHGHWVCMVLPEEATKWYKAFDRSAVSSPFTFELEVPDAA